MPSSVDVCNNLVNIIFYYFDLHLFSFKYQFKGLTVTGHEKVNTKDKNCEQAGL